MRFNFTGNAYAETDDSKKGYFDRSGITKESKEPYTSITFSVASANNNRGYVECFGMKQDTIKTVDVDGNKIEIDWDDRDSEGVLKTVRSKKVMNFTEDGRKEFIADLDIANFIKEHVYELNKKKVTVTGQVKKNFYQGNAKDRFVIDGIYAATDDKKNGLNITGDFFFTKDSIDTADWKKDRKIIINGYTEEYVPSEKANKYVSRQLIFDCSKVDFDNERHVNLANYRISQIGLKLEDGVIKNNLKAKNVYKIPVVISYINGAEEIAFDESELTENQKTAIELGLKTLDDFRPKGKIYGDKIVEYKLTDFDLRGDYADGCVTIEDTLDEFEKNIYVPAKEEDEGEIMNKPTSKNNDKDDIDIDDEDLFS